jgi:hypothetical protein
LPEDAEDSSAVSQNAAFGHRESRAPVGFVRVDPLCNGDRLALNGKALEVQPLSQQRPVAIEQQVIGRIGGASCVFQQECSRGGA